MSIFSAPLRVYLGITGMCNLRCKHCCASTSWGAADISTRGMINIIDQLCQAKVLEVAIFGGEPLIREDIFALLARFNRYPIVVNLNTNATLITKDMAKRLARDNNIITNYVVSLDGPRNTHDSIRGSKSYLQALKGIECLVGEGARVILSCTVMKSNIKTLDEVARIGKALGVSKVKFNRLYYCGNAGCHLDAIAVSFQDDMRARRRILKLSDQYGQFIVGSSLDAAKLFDGTTVPAAHPERGFCGAGILGLAIRPDGWITPCTTLWDVKVGNLKKNTFLDIWRHSPVLNKFRQPVEAGQAVPPGCRSCAYRSVCFWGQKCNEYYFPGGINNIKSYCYMSQDASGRGLR